MSWSDLVFILPEIVLAIGASVLLVAPFLGIQREGEGAKWLTLLVLALTASSVVYASWLTRGVTAGVLLEQMFTLDGFAIFFKLLFVGLVALVVLISSDFLREGGFSPWEYYALLAFALCGMMFMVSGTHLVSIYVGLELMSLSSYVLAGYFKSHMKSTEAAMKYFILGSMSSAVLLYGVSLIYGVVGSLGLRDLRAAIVVAGDEGMLLFGIMLLGAGLLFKVAAAPFHVWTPDVYVGAPTPVTAFLSTASKAAAFAIFARIFYEALGQFHADWEGVLAVVAALSMIIGNLAAITQTNVKRMLAYSSIGHAGYALLGIIALSRWGLHSVLIYMFVYAFATIGVWATVLVLGRRDYAGESVDDFDGLGARAPFFAFAMIVFLLSLGGIPPTAGFIGKYYLFAAAIEAGYAWLAVIAVLMSAVSFFYYFRIVKAMYLADDREGEFVVTQPLKIAVGICLVITLLFGILPESLIGGVTASLEAMVTTIAAR
jgi:NADH-quinone oxidoreductase subunit N